MGLSDLPAWSVLPIYVAMESAVVLIVNLSGDENGKPRYNTSSLVMVQELLKLSISLHGLSQVPDGFRELMSFPLTQWLKFGVPGLLYCINNNLFHHVLAGNMPAAFQVLLNLRVLWTGFMFMWLLNRVLTPRQWAACGVLVVGALVSQSQLLFSGSDTSEMTFVGLTLTFAYTWISVGAGVYNELLLKTGGSRSIHLANVPLYMFGVFFNLLVLLVQGSGDERGFWTGWGLPSTWVLVVLQAFVGLGVSAIVRKYDNVVKILCNTVVNIVVYIFSVMFLGYSVQLDFVLGASLVLTAAYIYNTSPKSEAATPQKRDAESGSSRK